MEGELEENPKHTHTSADDLNDGFILDKDDRRTLSYQVHRAGKRIYPAEKWTLNCESFHLVGVLPRDRTLVA